MNQSNNKSAAAKEFELQMIKGLAEYYRNAISDNVKRVLAKKKQHSNNCAKLYTKVKKTVVL